MSKRKSLFDRVFRSRNEPISQEDLAKFLGGEASWSGLEVDRASALGISAVWASVRVLSESLASLPIFVYRRTEDGKERAEDHWLYRLLHQRPNSEQSPFNWKEQLEGHLVLHGNAYCQKERTKGNTIKNLWPLDPEKMKVSRKGKDKQFIYTQGGIEKTFSQDEVFHIPGLGYDGLKGYSVLTVCKQVFGSASAANRYGAELFKNESTPSGFISLAGKLKDEKALKRMQASWEESHKSWGKKKRMAILEEGATFQALSIPPDDAQFLETRKFTVNEIARIFRIPPHMIADLEHATFSNIEHQAIEFVVHSIRPWLVRWEQAISGQLLSPVDQKAYFVEFLVDALLRGDATTRWTAYRTAREIGVLSANEIRAMENMNPIKDGDMYFVPMNWVPADLAEEAALTSPTTPGEPEGEPEEELEETESARRTRVFREFRQKRSAQARHRIAGSFVSLFSDAVRRVLNKEIRELRKGMDKHLGTRGLEDFDLFMDEMYRSLPEYIRQQMTPVYQSLAEAVKGELADEIGIDGGLVPENEEFIHAFVTIFAGRYIGTSKKEIRTALERAVDVGIDAVEELNRKLDYWETARPSRMANNETVRGSNAFAKSVYILAGVTHLRWVALGSKTCPYCSQLDGSVVGVEKNYVMSGDVIDAAPAEMNVQSNIGHPPLHTGCVCQIVAG